MAIPVSSLRACRWSFHARGRFPLLPPLSAQISKRAANQGTKHVTVTEKSQHLAPGDPVQAVFTGNRVGGVGHRTAVDIVEHRDDEEHHEDQIAEMAARGIRRQGVIRILSLRAKDTKASAMEGSLTRPGWVIYDPLKCRVRVEG